VKLKTYEILNLLATYDLKNISTLAEPFILNHLLSDLNQAQQEISL